MPELGSNVTAAQNAPYWDEPLAAIDAKRGKVNQMLVGLGGSLITLLTRVSVEVEGKTYKHLTTPGKWVLACAILGFAGSFASEMLKASIQAKQTIRAETQAALNAERESEEARWRTRSRDLTTAILKNTNDALTQLEENLRSTIEAREKVLSDNLMRETRLYGRLHSNDRPSSVSARFERPLGSRS